MANWTIFGQKWTKFRENDANSCMNLVMICISIRIHEKNWKTKFFFENFFWKKICFSIFSCILIEMQIIIRFMQKFASFSQNLVHFCPKMVQFALFRLIFMILNLKFLARMSFPSKITHSPIILGANPVHWYMSLFVVIFFQLLISSCQVCPLMNAKLFCNN